MDMFVPMHFCRLFLFAVVVLSQLYACASRPKQNADDQNQHVAQAAMSPDDVEKLINEVSLEFGAGRTETGDTRPESTRGIPFEVNDRVKKWIHFFTVKDRARFQEFLNRGTRFSQMISKTLGEQGIPDELYYLAMIESGFVMHATSRAKAVGIWQFIEPTAERYGLQVDQYVDERRDPMRATVAAAMYLRDLHLVFQSWYLAMAAYNAGEARIVGAMMRAKSRNFWELAEKNVLPIETLNYVPKFIAAAIIGHHPKEFGFSVDQDEAYPEVSAIAIPPGLALLDLSKVTKIPLRTLRELNPSLRKQMAPPGEEPYEIWVLPEHAESINEKRTELIRVASKSVKLESIRQARSNTLDDHDRNEFTASMRYHRVRRGDTLALISRKYNLRIDYLKRLNNLKSNSLQVGRLLKLGGEVATVDPKKIKFVEYRVRRGDNLQAIASRFGVPVKHIKNKNALKSNTVRVGQLLKIAADNNG